MNLSQSTDICLNVGDGLNCGETESMETSYDAGKNTRQGMVRV